MAPTDLQLLHRLDRVLPPTRVDNIARHAGFLVRASSKITPRRLLLALGLLAASLCSLQLIASTIACLAGCSLSKQAVQERLNPSTSEFLRRLLAAALASIANLPAHIASRAFAPFRRVLIHDSTTIPLPPSMANLFPGPKNQTKKNSAALKIQTLYNLLAESFLSFQLTPFTRNDQAASSDIIPLLQPGDLLLRDLGYFALPVPTSLANRRRRKLRANRDKRLHPSKQQLQLLDWQLFITNVPLSLWDAQTVANVYSLRWRIESIFKAWKNHLKIGLTPNPSSHQIEAIIYTRLLWISLFHSFVFLPLSLHAFASSAPHISLLKLAAFFTQNPGLFLASTPNLPLFPLLLRHCAYDKRKRRNYYQNILSLT